MSKTGLDDYLVHCGPASFRALVNRTPYDESFLELQKTSLNLLNFADKYGFCHTTEKQDIAITKLNSTFHLSNPNLCDGKALISVYVDDALIVKEELNLHNGSKKDAFIRRCKLGKEREEETRRFLDVIVEFLSLHSEVSQKESQIKRELREKFPSTLSISQKKRDAALKLAKSPDLLYRVRQVLGNLGLVGEFFNGLLLYLVVVSRLLSKPISVIVKGSSSAGKSFLVKTILNLFPEEAYIELTGLTPKALVYLNEPFSHRFLIIYEVHGVKEEEYTEYMIRTLLSENKIRYAVVKKNELEEHETKIIEREGPTGLITTTTYPNIHDENETRLFSIAISETVDQTINIKGKIADDYQEVKAKVDESELEALINLQRILEPVPVRIPYAKVLAELTPNEPIRTRRDFQRILAVIEVVALLHQHQRKIKEIEGVGYIEAKLEDYFIAKSLLEEPLNLTLRNKYPQTVELVKTVGEIYEQTKASVTVKQLQGRFKRPKMTITRWLKPALEYGWVENVGEEGKGKPLKLIPGKFEDTETSLLPSIETLGETFPDLIQNFEVVDPITGKKWKCMEE